MVSLSRRPEWSGLLRAFFESLSFTLEQGEKIILRDVAASRLVPRKLDASSLDSAHIFRTYRHASGGR